MNNNKTNKIDVRVNIDTSNKFNKLLEYHGVSKTKLVEKMIDIVYDKDIMENDLSSDVKKDCMTHMCKIVVYTNCIEDDEVKNDILEEVTKACQTLR